MTNAKRSGNKGTNSGKSKPDSASGGKRRTIWVNPYLTKEDGEWLDSNFDQFPNHIAELLEHLPDGYSITLGYDGYSERHKATCFCNADNDPNSGKAVSVRASSATDALYALAYCLLHKLEPEWPASADSDKGRWG